MTMKFLIIAKPWRGGLGRYYYAALSDLFPHSVTWIKTRPESLKERIIYKWHRPVWWQILRDRIESSEASAVFFVGFQKEFSQLKPDPRYVLFAFDRLCIQAHDVACYGKIFLSDPGYTRDLLSHISMDRYGGVLPFAAYPPIHQQKETFRDDRDVCFIGNRDPKRDCYLVRALQEKFTTKIYGNYYFKSPLFFKNPTCFHRSVPNEKLASIYAQYKLSLNIHAEVVREGTNMRSFECANAQIPQLIEYRHGLEEYFDLDREIVVFQNPDEMIEKAHRLIKDQALRQRLSEQALKRVYAEHTYYHRIVTALAHLVPRDRLESALATVMRSLKVNHG